MGMTCSVCAGPKTPCTEFQVLGFCLRQASVPLPPCVRCLASQDGLGEVHPERGTRGGSWEKMENGENLVSGAGR